MKITQMPSTQRAVTPQQQNKTAKDTAKKAPLQSADDITQDGLQTAQQTLDNDVQSDVDYDKVAQMQAVLNNGMAVDTDELASAMLNFFQK